MALFVIVRLKGDANLRKDVRYTLKLLGLHKVNHATLQMDTPSIKGMLQKAKDAIAWGEIDRETLKNLIMKRGRLPGNKRISEGFFKQRNISLDKMVDELEVPYKMIVTQPDITIYGKIILIKKIIMILLKRFLR